MATKKVPSKAYQHSKLTSVSSIRLIRLLGGALNDNLRCEISMVDIGDDLTYEAVSYVWGTSKIKPSIQVLCEHGDSELEIPGNLEGALRRFRYPTSTRTLWIDSICINQSDIQERNQQVQLMGQIYQRASTVLIWLGEDVDNAMKDQACSCMNSLKSARPKLKEIAVGEFEGLSENTTQVNSFLGIKRQSSDDVHQGIGIPLLGSPAFDALLDLLKNPWFSRAWTWQESFLAKERKFFRGSWTCKDLVDGYQSVLPMLAGIDFWTRRKESPKSYLKLPALLALRRGSGCTYPSDLLYSLLGAAWEATDIEVDYKQPFKMAFAKSTWQIMVQRSNLSILSEVQKDRHSSTLPSWAPDWRVRGETVKVSDYLQQVIRYAAAGSSKPRGGLSDDAKVLTLSGLKWDRVSHVKDATSEELDEWVDSMFATIVDGKNVYAPTKESLERALRRMCYLDKTDFTAESETTRWKPDSHENFEKIVQRALSTEQRDKVRYGILLHSLINARRSRVIFVTEGGRLGIASDNARQGDVIAMLLGGEVPIVLRPLKNQVEQYTFVAECYVHGFMDGESFIDARRSAQPEHDPTDVAWLKDLEAEEIPFPVQNFHIH